jgi:hypothetical protein
MPYTIRLSNGTKLVEIPDGAVDTATTSINLVGRNLAGYGPYQNENFVYLLENFANETPPDSPVLGQIWFDTVSKKLRILSQIVPNAPKHIWKAVAEIAVQNAKPLLQYANTGDLWYDDTAKQLNIFNGSDFDLIGTSVPGFGKSRLEGSVINGTPVPPGPPRDFPVLTLFLDDAPIAIVSKDTFVPTSPIPGLHLNSEHPGHVNAGINLVGPTLLNANADQAHKFIDYEDGPLETTSFVRTDSEEDQNIIAKLTVKNRVNLEGADDFAAGQGQYLLEIKGGEKTSTSEYGDKISFKVSSNRGLNELASLNFDNSLNTPFRISSDFLIIKTGTNKETRVDQDGNVIPAGTFIGNLTGNVTGDLSGSPTGTVNTQKLRADKLLTRDGLTTVIDLTTTTPEVTANFIGNLTGNVAATTVDTTGDVSVGGDLTVDGTITVTGGSATGMGITGGTITSSQISNATITNSSLTSPTLTGNPVAPTQERNDNSTKLATTAFVHSVLPNGAIIMWSGSVSNIPDGWSLCDGTVGTPDLRNKFIIGAGSGLGYLSPATTGGSQSASGATTSAGGHSHGITVQDHNLTINEIPSHAHDYDDLYGLNDDASPGVIDRYGNRIERYSAWGSDGDADSGNPAWFYSRTANAGSGAGHSHGASSDAVAGHTHTLTVSDIRPPFFALCYIMKVY